ncbi:hypothetical protein BKA62DRAFT_776101 [Auriculariales sp. MPI-PUGE-AT-0066]|nr:hypothetical protein BKA62DRAFT_776101 [Auriculariales sp. MPI-PUGE-AT-0066]
MSNFKYPCPFCRKTQSHKNLLRHFRRACRSQPRSVKNDGIEVWELPVDCAPIAPEIDQYDAIDPDLENFQNDGDDDRARCIGASNTVEIEDGEQLNDEVHQPSDIEDFAEISEPTTPVATSEDEDPDFRRERERFLMFHSAADAFAPSAYRGISLNADAASSIPRRLSSGFSSMSSSPARMNDVSAEWGTKRYLPGVSNCTPYDSTFDEPILRVDLASSASQPPENDRSASPGISPLALEVESLPIGADPWATPLSFGSTRGSLQSSEHKPDSVFERSSYRHGKQAEYLSGEALISR